MAEKLIIDMPLSVDITRFFSEQINLLTKGELKHYNSVWNGNQSDDYYRGLIAGMAVVEAMLQQDLRKQVLGVIAFTADKLAQKEIV